MTGSTEGGDQMTGPTERGDRTTAPTGRGGEELEVVGMTCDNCVAHVSEALEGVAGVSAVEVDLETGHARVLGVSLDRDALVAAVRAEGYDVAGPSGGTG